MLYISVQCFYILNVFFTEKNPGLETKFKKSNEKASESYQETDDTDENPKVLYSSEIQYFCQEKQYYFQAVQVVLNC
jgi:hypothetical protein